MGYLIKPIGELKIRIDNYQILSKTQLLNIDKSLIQKREGFDIIVYPEINDEFNYFYAKHVQRRAKEKTFSVLVIDNEYPLSEKATRLLLNQVILNAKEIEENKPNYYKIQQIIKGHTISIRKWNSEINQFVDKSKDCCFILRDIKNVSSFKDLYNLTKFVNPKELKSILEYIQKAKNQEEMYIIRRVLLIGKYFVVS